MSCTFICLHEGYFKYQIEYIHLNFGKKKKIAQTHNYVDVAIPTGMQPTRLQPV